MFFTSIIPFPTSYSCPTANVCQYARFNSNGQGEKATAGDGPTTSPTGIDGKQGTRLTSNITLSYFTQAITNVCIYVRSWRKVASTILYKK